VVELVETTYGDQVVSSREEAAALDAASPLADRRSLFDLPDHLIYLCGNSLGALPKAVVERIPDVVRREWGEGLVGSWNSADWTHLATRVSAQIAPLIGAAAEDVTVGDSTSVTLFKSIVAAARMQPDRSVVVVEPSTFPTDGYVADGAARSVGMKLRWSTPGALEDAFDEDVAVAVLNHVDFRTGALLDMEAVTAAAHDMGVLTVWDLCHSVGALPIDVSASGADFAVACTYKYLNGGPGSPAFVWVAPRHQDHVDQPITGWWGHARPFEMGTEYEPGPGISRMVVGTPPVIALSSLESALTAFDGVSLDDLRAASLSLADLFISLVEERLPDFEVITPRAHERRGSQASLRHPLAYTVVQALAARRVVGDFRTPDVLRFGFAPLYVRYVDVWDAVEQIVGVLEQDEHLDPAYAEKQVVT
jgi:kynureninase